MIIPDYVNRVTDNQPKPLTKELFLSFLRGMDVKMNCEIVRQHKPNAEAYKRMLPAVTWQSTFSGKLRTDANAQPTGLFCLDVDIHHEDMFKVLCKSEGYEEAYAWAENEAKHRAQEWAKRAKEEEQTLSNLCPPSPKLPNCSASNGQLLLKGENKDSLPLEEGRGGSELLNIVGIHVSPSGTGVHVIACCHSSCKSIEENQARLARLLGTSYDAVCKDWARIFFLTPEEDWTYLDLDNIFEEDEN